jgi:hypothetical protein
VREHVLTSDVIDILGVHNTAKVSLDQFDPRRIEIEIAAYDPNKYNFSDVYIKGYHVHESVGRQYSMSNTGYGGLTDISSINGFSKRILVAAMIIERLQT